MGENDSVRLEILTPIIKYERIETPDGSVTYRNTEVGATYRSVHGAESESRYVFLEGTGLPDRPGPWRVLELGFGTGLNFSTTVRAAAEKGVELEYVSLEPAPLPPDHWLVDPQWHDLNPGQPLRLGTVTLTVVPDLWQDYCPPQGHFHACFHDPFGPAISPECWTADCFRWSYGALACDGVLATFGAASATRWAMKEAGFLVARLPGAKPKREMTIASKSAERIAHGKPWKRNL
jgi:tRNA U34 5-methylaminomethyl-2-thiouridine-forming methyltransferase MnmC